MTTAAEELWLLLIPFGIVNAAQYMFPAPTSAPSRTAPARNSAAVLLGLAALVGTEGSGRLPGMDAVVGVLAVAGLRPARPAVAGPRRDRALAAVRGG